MSMIQQARTYKAQLAIVGSGLAGFASSIFALERGLTAAQVGNTGSVAYTTGYFDLLGAQPVGSDSLVDPWAGLDALRAEQPGHPYARISNRDIRNAMSVFVDAVTAMGVDYTLPGDRNLSALTPAGTRKPTLCIPGTMAPGIDACAGGAPTLIVDILGLQGFSAKEVVANLAPAAGKLFTASVGFPDMDSGAQVYAEVMARALQVSAHREQFAERLKAVAGHAEYIGLPAILGVHQPDHVHREMEKLVGVRLFEIPTIPPAVPGIRLREMFEQAFPEKGLALVPQQKVQQLTLNQDQITLELKDSYGHVKIQAETVILATGRFLSGGLIADRTGVREPLLNLPVAQPEGRSRWYQEDYFDPRGHDINRAGLEVDDGFRPLGKDGEPVNQRLFCAGAVLAHQDWIRQRCGAGIAIASAYRAVSSAAGIIDSKA